MKPSKIAKLHDYKTQERIDNAQKYANKHTNGNLTEATNKMIDKALLCDNALTPKKK